MKNIDIEKKFFKVVNFLEGCSDTIVKNKHGVIIERGTTIDDDNRITYGLDDNLIRFYSKGKEILSFGEKSPILLMFENIIEPINEF
ncbi:hypothetical protein FDB40_09975 [Clostridium botulinum]|nr:hypothetical protein [Clostridium botulinum]